MHSQTTIKRALYLEPFLSIPKVTKLKLLGHYLKMPHLQVLANLDLEIPELVFDDYYNGLKKLDQGLPLEYITNTKGFYESDFYVNENVLIPRPETEILVQTAIDLNLPEDYKAIDLGTGSGCIAISLAKKYPNSDWIAVDISSKALEVAKKNIDLNAVKNINLKESNLLESVPNKKFNLITANLPYIGTQKFAGVCEKTKRFEPNIALFSGSDGLDLYRQLSKSLKDNKIEFDYLLAEFADNQGLDLISVFKNDFPDLNYRLIKDLNQKERILLIFQNVR